MPFGIPDPVLDVGAAAARVLTAAREVANAAPRLEDEVTVEVLGHPGASKQELYFLALAAANGMVRRSGALLSFNPAVAPTMGVLMIEYDAADNWVRCTIQYNTSMVAASTFGGRNIPGRLNGFYDTLAVYRGPQCAVVGGQFDFVSTTLPGIPTSAADRFEFKDGGGAPNLPFAGSTILTSCPTVIEPSPGPIVNPPPPSMITKPGPVIPSPNPKPPGDNRSRGVVIAPQPGAPMDTPYKCCEGIEKLIPLVFAALTDPAGSNKTAFTPPTQGPRGS